MNTTLALLSLLFFGDSITHGYGLPDDAMAVSWPGVISAVEQRPAENHSTNNWMAADIADAVYAADNRGVSYVMIGTNDQRIYGYNGAKANNWQRIVGAELAWLTLETEPARTSRAWSFEGDWTRTLAYGVGMTSMQPGASATAEFEGDTLLLGYIMTDHGRGAFSVTIDGVDYGPVASYGQSGTALETAKGRRYAPALLRVPGLGKGPHTVRLTVQKGPVFVDWVAAGPRAHARVLVSRVQRMTPAAYARYGGSDEAVDLLNARLDELVGWLREYGADLEIFDPALTASHLLPDGVHPNQPGHWRIACAALDATYDCEHCEGEKPPVRCAR